MLLYTLSSAYEKKVTGPFMKRIQFPIHVRALDFLRYFEAAELAGTSFALRKYDDARTVRGASRTSRLNIFMYLYCM